MFIKMTEPSLKLESNFRPSGLWTLLLAWKWFTQLLAEHSWMLSGFNIAAIFKSILLHFAIADEKKECLKVSFLLQNVGTPSNKWVFGQTSTSNIGKS